MLFLFLLFFFFIFTFKTKTQHGWYIEDLYKSQVRFYYRSFRLRGIPLSTHFFELTEFTIDCLFWTMRCGMQRTIVFSLSFLSFCSLSLYLSHSYIHTHTYTFALSNSPSFLSSIQMKPQGDVIARANTYVERELFTVRMQEEKTGSFHRDVP